MSPLQVIACEVCGTDNDSKLTFCRTCGHRLQKKSRVVPPTPATGMKKAKPPAARDVEGAWPLEGEAAAGARPSAPPLELDIAPDEDDVPAGKTKCGQCAALSPEGYRFCISCGTVLKGKAAPPAKPSPTKSGMDEAPRPVKKVQPPARGGAALEKVACKDCGGMCEGGESFCKYCGAPLPKSRAAPGAAPRSHRPDKPKPKPLPKARPRDVPSSIPAPPAKPPPDPFPLSSSADAEREPAVPTAPARRAKAEGQVSGRLVVIVEDGSEGKTLELRGRQVDIGSGEGDIILAEDRYLSPRHARFFRQEGRWYLRDLASLNGVYRRLRKPTPLRHGDLVLLGLEVLEFHMVDHAERGLGHAIQHGVLVFGSPAATRRARLCQRTVEGVIRDVYHLVADETTVGRETGDIVFTSDPFMSRRHAAIQWDEDAQEYVLVDLNSSNGTYLAIRDDVPLDNGDFIRLGQHLFRVDLPTKPKREPSS
jgi:pSer/pThr/pTyr-binding forkhead associated (FHA) protein